MTQPESLWEFEHGPGYDVPWTISQAEGMTDTSWHNDTCPSFGVRLDDVEVELTIWCEHPDPEQRESQSLNRFTVAVRADSQRGVEILTAAGVPHTDVDYCNWFSSDLADEALVAFVGLLGRVHEARRFAGRFTNDSGVSLSP